MIFKEPFEQYIGKRIAQEYGKSMIQGVIYRVQIRQFSAIEKYVIFYLIRRDEDDYSKLYSGSIGVEEKDGTYSTNNTYIDEPNEVSRQTTIKGIFQVPRKDLG
jgi:hypothetical protein